MFFHPISNINKTLWLLIALLSAIAASAQQPTCSLKIDQLPDSVELRGFRLGMTYDQVKARVPQAGESLEVRVLLKGRFGPAVKFEGEVRSGGESIARAGVVVRQGG